MLFKLIIITTCIINSSKYICIHMYNHLQHLHHQHHHQPYITIINKISTYTQQFEGGSYMITKKLG